jgi:hypothetical protein
MSRQAEMPDNTTISVTANAAQTSIIFSTPMA